MIITFTSITLKSPWKFFSLSNNGRKIQSQAKRSPGFIKMKNTGWWKQHYTVSAWDSEDAMKKFARSGAHLDAMKKTANLASELRTYTFEANEIPDWKSGKELLKEKGKVIAVK